VTDFADAPTAAARAYAWTGAALFAASLGYFLFSYVVTFGESAAGRPAWRDIAIDVALFSAFALHHSAFARAPLRRWVGRAVSSQLERSTYVWVASLMLIGVCALWRPIGGVAWTVSGPGVWLMWAAMLGGVWLTLRSAAIIDVWDLAGVRTDAARSPESATEFRTDGPYGWVRHPIYSGWFLIVFSVTPMTMTRLVFGVVSCAYLLVAIPLEERSLRATSGGYRQYMQQVRWKLVPGIY
jgi:protein-S-isoprenylcysteine O-methyltransferase Ste14